MLTFRERYPNCADGLSSHEEVFADIDQQAACLTGYDQHYQQISPGRYTGWFRTVLLGEKFGLYFETIDQDLDQWGAAPADHYGVVFFMREGNFGWLGSTPFDHDSLLYLTPGAGFDFRARAGAHFCVINIAADVFELFLTPCLPGGVDHHLLSGHADSLSLIDRDRLQAQTLRQMVMQALSLAGRFAGGEEDKSALTGFQISLAGLMAGYLASALARRTPDCRTEAAAAIANDIALAARDRIRRSAGAHQDIAELAGSLGVSRRSLEYAFRDRFGQSPAVYRRIVQLNAFRSALVSEANRQRSIGDIAADLGIWHLSRLAQNYRAHFGELPSDTRRAQERV